MNKRPLLYTITLFTFVSTLSGCAGMGEPMNATEFREVVRKAPLKVHESREVARPFKEVSKTLRERSSECLNITIKWKSNRASGLTTFKPTYIGDARHAELHVQRKMEGEKIIGKHPAEGTYRIVLDATPLSPTRTKIDIYQWSARDDRFLNTTLSGWVDGTNLGCPDL